MIDRNCEVYDYRTAYMQSLSGVDEVPVRISTVGTGFECPEECPGTVEIVEGGMFPKSILECPINGTKVQLGRLATFVRQSPIQ